MSDFEEDLRRRLRHAAAEIGAAAGDASHATSRAVRALFFRRLTAAGVSLALAAGVAAAAVQLPDDGSPPIVTVPASPTREAEPSPSPTAPEPSPGVTPSRETVRRPPVPPGNGRSEEPAISAEGLHIVYTSEASNLVPADANHCATTYSGKSCPDVFLRDLVQRRTERVSVDSHERESHPIGDRSNLTPFPPPLNPVVSGDGRFVAFDSDAPDLVEDDTNQCGDEHDGFFPCTDVFVRDRREGTTVRVSVTSDGEQRDAISDRPAISRDGRFVAFGSGAALADDDTNDHWDIYVHDLQNSETTRVSLSSEGVQGDGDSLTAAISADGRFVAFRSDASNLVPDDTNGREDVFVHDRETDKTERVSVSSSGDQLDETSTGPKISASGRYVVFSYRPEDSSQVYIRDREAQSTRLVSVSSSEGRGNRFSLADGVSDDGRFVVFTSLATNLVPGDTNEREDVFVRDRSRGTTVRVSVSSSGRQSNGLSHNASMSADGTRIVFVSYSDNLVPGDENYVCDPVYDDSQKRCPDIFLHYLDSQQTILVSKPSTE